MLCIAQVKTAHYHKNMLCIAQVKTAHYHKKFCCPLNNPPLPHQ